MGSLRGSPRGSLRGHPGTSQRTLVLENQSQNAPLRGLPVPSQRPSQSAIFLAELRVLLPLQTPASIQSQEFHLNLAPMLVTIFVNSLVLPRRLSAFFLPVLSPDASASSCKLWVSHHGDFSCDLYPYCQLQIDKQSGCDVAAVL